MKNDDIQFENNNKIFNYRVAIVIKNKNKILIQKDSRINHLTFPGGRCKLGETSSETASREFFEETGIKTNFVKEIGFIENFFISNFNGKNFHEILMIIELKFTDNKFYSEDIIKNIEDEKSEYIEYIWKNCKELKKIDFKPNIILDKLDNDQFFHLINKD